LDDMDYFFIFRGIAVSILIYVGNSCHLPGAFNGNNQYNVEAEVPAYLLKTFNASITILLKRKRMTRLASRSVTR
jgi:hypothetical protein